MDIFDEFASNLVRELEKCFFSCVSSDVPFRSKHMKREKVWSCFHSLRVSKLNSDREHTDTKHQLVHTTHSELLSCYRGLTLDIQGSLRSLIRVTFIVHFL